MRYLYTLFALIGVGCTCNDDSSFDAYDTLQINFDISTTKGELINEPSQMGSFGVYCSYTASKAWSTDASFNKLRNQRLDYDLATDKWVYDGTTATWDAAAATDNYTFCAYSPYATDDNGITPNSANGDIYITYVTPTECTDQPDLMLAIPQRDVNPMVSGCVTLTFRHALASVGFSVIGMAEEVVKSVAIKNIMTRGLVSLDDQQQIEWRDLGTLSDMEYTAKIDTTVSPNITTPQTLTLTDGYLMMIPQEITDIEVVVTSLNTTTDTERTTNYTFNEGDTWLAGNTYQYTINLNSYDYTIEGTASCYMLHPDQQSTTTYYIPVEGRINTFWRYYADDKESYKDRLSSSDKWTTQILWHDYDSGIDGFEVERVTSGFTPNTEAVTPQSAPNFTTPNARSAMQVTLPRKFDEGNIVVAVLLDDEILWSWHLWITDYDPDTIAAQCSATAGEYTYSVGRYKGEVHRYDDSSLWSSDNIYGDKFIMDRNIGALDTDYNSSGKGVLYYQFGRKDPMPHSTASGGVTIDDSDVQVSFITAVQNPTTFYTRSDEPYGWCNESVESSDLYLWNDKNVPNPAYFDDKEHIKSIFDPSPLGWRLPIHGTYANLGNSNCSSNGSELVYVNEIYFPFTGYRSNQTGNRNDYGSAGNLRLATPINASFAYNLAYSSTIQEKNNTRSDGFCVRAIQE
ncbi:MAG: fimbrillin family protein [Rikenellaceae bacterium]